MLHTIGCHEFPPEDAYLLAKGAAGVAGATGLFLVGWMRHARHVGLVKGRIARDECIACGYPRGVHNRCTECGTRVRASDGGTA